MVQEMGSVLGLQATTSLATSALLGALTGRARSRA